ncbi:peptidoglycan-binding domain-containing protein [Streptomyces sp. NPDC048565]|uniref:peptidoglycan-binding domain-containing protein n=1 Tax=Streptomyces sp. NPDC048565 TaxID=3155266 RepID=UPI00342FA109
MTGHVCPECGGEQSVNPGAGCACGARTPEPDARPAQSATAGAAAERTTAAEIAAAEDFDPLRIRPYVTLSSEDTQDHGAPAAATTMPLFLEGAAGGSGAPGDTPGGPPGTAAADEAHRRTAAAYAGGGPDPVQPRRRRPFAAIAVGAAVAAVVGTAAFASGLFDDKDSRDAALPEATTSMPDTDGGPAASVSQSPSSSSSPSPSATPSRSASASPSASASASTSPSASRPATASTSPSPSASATKAPATTAAAAPVDEAATGPTLRRGDRGPEVSELQRRLQEVWAYRGPENGDYSRQVEEAVAEYQRWVSVQGDPPGVYGPETRRALEARTSGRGHRP